MGINFKIKIYVNTSGSFINLNETFQFNKRYSNVMFYLKVIIGFNWNLCILDYIGKEYTKETVNSRVATEKEEIEIRAINIV